MDALATSLRLLSRIVLGASISYEIRVCMCINTRAPGLADILSGTGMGDVSQTWKPFDLLSICCMSDVHVVHMY